jgi:ABC-2 type transport system permease protein
MRTLLAMAGKDLRRRVRAPLATILLLAFPLVFSGLLALTFGGAEAKVPKVRLLLEDRDGGLVAQLVASAFSQGEAQKYFEVKKVEGVAGDGAALIEKEGATALLRLPKGFSDAVFAGRPAQIELVESPAQSILPDIAEQVATVLAEGLSAASRLLRAPLEQLRAQQGPGAPSDARVAEIAVLFNHALGGSRQYLLPPVVTLETAVREEPGAHPKRPAGGSSSTSIFLLFLPGIAIYSLFNLADQSMRDLLVEARQKTLRRQLAGPLTAGRVLAGKALATAALAAISIVLLSAIGAIVARRAVSFPGYILLSLAVVAAATGFASAVFALARNEKQGATLASLLSLLMAFAGGSFIPLNSLPAGLRALSPYSLMYWGADGYQKLVQEGAGLRGVLPNVAILAGAGLLLVALSAPLWQRRLLRGELT